MKFSLVLMSLVAAVRSADAGVVFVNAALTTGAGTGTSWADAYQGRLGLEAALTAAQPGDDLWVAQGVYAPAGANGSIMAAFALKSGVRVLGGFVGTESSEMQRDPALRVTTLTGDLKDDDESGFPPFSDADNVAHVVRADGPGGSGVLDGFTITRGFASHRSPVLIDLEAGGGVMCQGASPVIARCVLVGNRAAGEGAGIAVFGGAATIDGCFFNGNRALVGGGVSSRSGAATTVRRCRFIESFDKTGPVRGLGIHAGAGPNGDDPNPGTINVRDCEFSNELAPKSNPDGVGIGVFGGTAQIEGCRFVRCAGVSGGGISASNATVVVDRCLFVDNEEGGDGGGALYSFENIDLTVTNCVFTGNDRQGGSTIHAQGGGVLRLINCTVFDNGAPTMTYFPLLIGNATACTIHNCIFNANKSGNPVSLPIGVKFGTGTINVASSCIEGWNGQFLSVSTFDADPLFVNAAGADGITGTEDDDLRLSAASPCIDRGNNGLVPAGVVFDLAGLPRFRDFTGVPDLGVGPAPVVDLGAHERVPTCPTDLNGDGATNTADLVLLIGAFGQSVLAFAAGDLDGTGLVNTADLVLFLGGFGVACP
ncbi:MAG: right-handed parallel beta-helix repeat-containing protein [Phycisphaerales bacterium]